MRRKPHRTFASLSDEDDSSKSRAPTHRLKKYGPPLLLVGVVLLVVVRHSHANNTSLPNSATPSPSRSPTARDAARMFESLDKLTRRPRVAYVLPIQVNLLDLLLDHAYANFESQVYREDLKILLICVHSKRGSHRRDGFFSDDDYAPILKLARKDPRVKFITSASKPFAAVLRNRAMYAFKNETDVFVNMDSDDVYHPLYTQRVISALRRPHNPPCVQPHKLTELTILNDGVMEFAKKELKSKDTREGLMSCRIEAIGTTKENGCHWSQRRWAESTGFFKCMRKKYGIDSKRGFSKFVHEMEHHNNFFQVFSFLNAWNRPQWIVDKHGGCAKCERFGEKGSENPRLLKEKLAEARKLIQSEEVMKSIHRAHPKPYVFDGGGGSTTHTPTALNQSTK